MKVAVIGSRSLFIDDLSDFIPPEATEIVSGGAQGIDRSARQYALENNIKLTEFFPDYKRYKKGAPLKRNLEIIEYADMVVAIWDGSSQGTKFVIEKCIELGKPVEVYEENASERLEKYMATLSEEQKKNQIELGVINLLAENRDFFDVDIESLERQWIKLYIKEMEYEKERRSRK